MVNDAKYLSAVTSMQLFNDKELAMASAACKICRDAAAAEGKKDIQAEMIAMHGEVVKEMVKRMVKRDGTAPDGLTLEQAIARIESETLTDLKELEAA